MHGIIHLEVHKFISEKFGEETLEAVLDKAGLERKAYIAIKAYPYKEMARLIMAARDITGIPARDILESFGEFLFPRMAVLYKAHIKPEWKTRELLLNIEDTIHKVVRRQSPGASPPALHFEPSGPSELTLTYVSSRHLESLARGMIKGAARYYGETVRIIEYYQEGGALMKVSII
ncbi:MAG TPA: heme NO-binding domain-containing protein [Calditrichia bacterium]|nr:heme NO-binding domain-containing protein [Calditrichota bacterium]HQU73578.1 heme NO-binding domain-containing protein [Calditrichia bacterium]HQV32683.1 heme NO-binding domain-containing protein [Calditrichia bacterium]